jgi:hypothetical protein
VLPLIVDSHGPLREQTNVQVSTTKGNPVVQEALKITPVSRPSTMKAVDPLVAPTAVSTPNVFHKITKTKGVFDSTKDLNSRIPSQKKTNNNNLDMESHMVTVGNQNKSLGQILTAGKIQAETQKVPFSKVYLPKQKVELRQNLKAIKNRQPTMHQ